MRFQGANRRFSVSYLYSDKDSMALAGYNDESVEDYRLDCKDCVKTVLGVTPGKAR
jgi:hypothetical protein